MQPSPLWGGGFSLLPIYVGGQERNAWAQIARPHIAGAKRGVQSVFVPACVRGNGIRGTMQGRCAAMGAQWGCNMWTATGEGWSPNGEPICGRGWATTREGVGFQFWGVSFGRPPNAHWRGTMGGSGLPPNREIWTDVAGHCVWKWTLDVEPGGRGWWA